ncbi:MAG: hypothetical protein J0M15_06105 [Deltaproteobacteria bacterium]|nr:hypothetical protein [Deltaproteobacteria bacterium]
MKFSLAILTAITASLSLSGCTPNEVSWSSNNYDQMKYLFSAENKTSSESLYLSGNNFELSYLSTDTIGIDTKLKLNILVEGSQTSPTTSFQVNDIFENLNTEMVLKASSNKLVLPFKIKSQLPYAESFKINITLSDENDSIQFSPSPIEIKITNDNYPQTPVVFSPSSGSYFRDHITIKGSCSGNNDIKVSASFSAANLDNPALSIQDSFTCSKEEFLIPMDLTSLADGLVYLSVSQESFYSNKAPPFFFTLQKDTQNPFDLSLIINNNSKYTGSNKVDLALSAKNADYMYLSNDPSCLAGGSWQAYSTFVTQWEIFSSTGPIPASGTSLFVSVKFKDNAGNESACISSSIKFNFLAPSTPLPSNFYTDQFLAEIFSAPLNFNGTATFFASAEDLSSTNKFTISVWVKPTSDSGFYTHISHLFWEGNHEGNGFGYTLATPRQEMSLSIGNVCLLGQAFPCSPLQTTDYTYKTVLAFHMGDVLKSESPDVLNVVVPFDVSLSQPQMITVTVDLDATPPKAEIYKDGIFMGSDTGGLVRLQRNKWDTPLRFGKSGKSDRYFKGDIFSTLVYSKVMTSSDIKQLCWEKQDLYGNVCN